MILILYKLQELPFFLDHLYSMRCCGDQTMELNKGLSGTVFNLVLTPIPDQEAMLQFYS